MEIIFGKFGTGIKELQGYFSHITGTMDFDEMKTDLLLAQEELHKYVGPGVVNEALAHYKSDNYKLIEEDSSGSGSGSGIDVAALTLKDNLVYHVQMAVCLLGYREYALNNDATHTKTGRTARMDKDIDQFDEKLIDRDDRALQRKAQKAIDRLLKFVDDNQFASWLNSDLYKQTRDLILWNATSFHRFHPIEYDMRLYMLLVPMIRTAQQEYVESILGETRLAGLLARVNANNIDGDASGSGASESARVLYDKCGSAIAYLSLAAGYRELPTQLFPESMSRNFWNAGNGLAFVGLRDKVIEALRVEGMRKINILITYITELDAKEAETEITDDTFTNIDERMDAVNKFARV